jgi:hypothetical protein
VEIIRLDFAENRIHLIAYPPEQGSIGRVVPRRANQTQWECYSGLGSNAERTQEGYNICASRYTQDVTYLGDRVTGALNLAFATNRTIRSINVSQIAEDLVRLDGFHQAMGLFLHDRRARIDSIRSSASHSDLTRLERVLTHSPFIEADTKDDSEARFLILHVEQERDRLSQRQKTQQRQAQERLAKARAAERLRLEQRQAANLVTANNNDIGERVCKFGTLQYQSDTGFLILGQAALEDHAQDGFIIAFLESISPQGQRVQLRSHGWGTRTGSTVGPVNTHPRIGEISSEPGRVFWAPANEWYFCNRLPPGDFPT